MAVSLEHEINIKLVENVQLHSCLYDPTNKFYSNISKKDAAWGKIASKINLLEKDCKERWRNIRSSYLRYLKNKSAGASAITPYYLSEYLQFLKPFTKPKARPDVLTFDSNNLENHSSFLLDQIGTEYNENSINAPTSSTSSTIFSLNSRHHNEGLSPNVFNKTANEYSNLKRNDVLTGKMDDPDLDFFKSLLPDFHTLPSAKKRRIKMEIMRLVDEACNEEGQEVSTTLPYSIGTTVHISAQNEDLEITDQSVSSFCQINVKDE